MCIVSKSLEYKENRIANQPSNVSNNHQTSIFFQEQQNKLDEMQPQPELIGGQITNSHGENNIGFTNSTKSSSTWFQI
jgi:hypothetical protein